MASGMPLPNDKKKLNLTQLRWNMRPIYSKKCGTKKGRKADVVNPVPDSTIKMGASLLLETPKLNHSDESVFQEASCNKTVSGKARKSLNFKESTPKSILKKK